jgi:hypothetical protein
MKSNVKIYGPPLLKAIRALEKVAIGMPEVCIWNASLAFSLPVNEAHAVEEYFSGIAEVPKKRCGTIISKSGESLGDNDFYFEWFIKPTMNELHNLIEKIDEALTPLGVKYSLTTN